MNSMRKAGFAAILLCSVLGAGCGDVFRPVAVPTDQQPGGNPQARRNAIVVNNAGGAQGTVTFVNVSGDTNLGNRPVGAGPVHAALTPTAGRVFVANQGDDSLSVMLTDFLTLPITRITLPTGAAPAYVFSHTVSVAYVALSGLDTVGIISQSDVLTQQIPVGANPVALAGIPGGNKVYSVNRGSNTVTSILTGENTVAATISVGTDPVWAAINPEGTFVYVVNRGSGTVSVIETATDTVVHTLNVGAAPETIYFDSRLRRLYVPNTGGNTVHVFRADAVTATVAPTPVAGSPVTVGAAPRSVVALQDGLRVYVANSGANTVSVLSSTSNSVIRTVTVGDGPAWVAASPDSTKVYAANRGGNSVSVIRTSDDTIPATIPSGSSQPMFIIVTP